MMLLYVLVVCSSYLCVESFPDFRFSCITPNREEAHCVSIFSCPPLMKAIGSLEPSSIDFVKKSVCWGCSYNDMKVCCGSSSNYIYYNVPHGTTLPYQFTFSKFHASTLNLTTQHTSNTHFEFKTTSRKQAISNTKTQISTTEKTVIDRESEKTVIDREAKKKILPSRKICGYAQTDDRPYTGNATALDEVPWMVHVIFIEDEEEDTEQYLDRCNGVLISNRYVLTSDYCATYAPKVRLGQYNTNKTVTCVENPDANECNDPWLDVEVEEEIHRLSIDIPRTKIINDLALLRLKESISFTDFIRPICLPLEETTKSKPAVHSFYYSGWGSLNPKMIEKKRLIYNLTSNDECYKIDKELKADTVNVSLMCVKPKEQNGSLACTGDEAGPLVYSYRHQWFVEGIIMKVYHDGGDGAERCSNTHPVSAIRITPEIVDWILDSIKV